MFMFPLQRKLLLLRDLFEDPPSKVVEDVVFTIVPGTVYPEFLPVDDEVFPAEEQPMPAADSPTHQSPGYIPESDPEEDPEEDDEEDPEEDPADYPADRGDDRDDEESSDDDDDDDDDAEEEEHLAPADPAAVAYSADQDPYLAYRVTARMSIRPQALGTVPLPSAVDEELLALPTPPPSPLSPYSSPLPQIPSPPLPIPSPPPNSPTYVEGSLGSRAAGIRQRDALPFCEFGYGITGIQGTDLVGAIQEIAPTTLEGGQSAFHRRTALLIKEGARVSHATWAQSMDACDQVHSEGISLRTTIMAQQSEIALSWEQGRRRQTVIVRSVKADHRRQDS
ncbi:hypothetical protein Tco_1174818 [Tanacetum coccineum]